MVDGSVQVYNCIWIEPMLPSIILIAIIESELKQYKYWYDLCCIYLYLLYLQ